MKELQLVEYIRKTAGKPADGVIEGIGDDCAVVKYRKNEHLLVASDMLVDRTHFEIKKCGYEKIGRKAVAVNISDIAAMGGDPKYITVSIGIPGHVKIPQIKQIYKGVKKICSEYGILLIGGDTNRSKVLVIDVSIMGLVKKKQLVKRSGAKKGDLILITGPVKDGKKEHLTFKPRLEESRYLTKSYKINSMIDTSDGIAPDIARICSQSNAGCTVFAEAVPLSKGLTMKDALYYGESFELLFTMSVKEARRLIRNTRAGKRRANYYVIGEITGPKEGLKLIEKNGRIAKLKVQGYCHL